jgi:hypothetical protein
MPNNKNNFDICSSHYAPQLVTKTLFSFAKPSPPPSYKTFKLLTLSTIVKMCPHKKTLFDTIYVKMLSIKPQTN